MEEPQLVLPRTVACKTRFSFKFKYLKSPVRLHPISYELLEEQHISKIHGLHPMEVLFEPKKKNLDELLKVTWSFVAERFYFSVVYL